MRMQLGNHGRIGGYGHLADGMPMDVGAGAAAAAITAADGESPRQVNIWPFVKAGVISSMIVWAIIKFIDGGGKTDV